MRQFFAFGLVLLFSPAAFAVLGGTESSIAADEINIKSSSHVRTSHGPYTAHQLQGSIHQVTEYVDSTGTVFALSWRGATRPDLNSLLGSYFAEYDSADSLRTRAKGARNQSVTIRTSQIVVQRAGHMRDLRGMAYIPTRLPAGVQPGELP